jgi:hypothetical protein
MHIFICIENYDYHYEVRFEMFNFFYTLDFFLTMHIHLHEHMNEKNIQRINVFISYLAFICIYLNFNVIYV